MSNVELTLPSVLDHGLAVRRFDIVEGMSMPFEVALVALSPDSDIDFERAIGSAASCRIDRGPLGARAWTGIVAHIAQLGVDPNGLSTYSLRIVPRLWLLGQRSDNRIFQHQTALEIVSAILAEHGVSFEARVDDATVPKLEARVQYAETDFDFVSRILEEAGISYLFEDGTSRLILADRPGSAPLRAGGPIPFSTRTSHEGGPYVSEVAVTVATRPGLVTVADFDLRRPRHALIYRAESKGAGEAQLEQYAYLPGSAIIDLPSARSSDTPAADDQSQARADEHQGRALAQKALGGARHDRRVVSFSTNVMDLAPGAVFAIAGAPRAELAGDQHLVVISSHYEGDLDGDWILRGVSTFASVPLLPAAKTPRPRIEGVQSAIVTGPPGSEIHTDEFGRVRVRFHWDRDGLTRDSANVSIDDRHSAWLRVDEGWAGAGFGMIATPRVGQEVLVGFYESNPDQPVVVGRVYGRTNPVPIALPGGMTTSTWRTRSSPSSDGFHEITFEDAVGHERLFVQSQKDLEKQVLNDEIETIERDQKAVVGLNRGATVGSEDTVKVGKVHQAGMAKMGEMHILEQGQPSVSELPTRYELIAKRITLSTGGAMIVLDGPDITVTAQSNVLIKAGDTVDIQGRPYVHINPPLVSREADTAKAEPPPDRIVTFQLVSEEGLPVAGARVHVTPEGGGEPVQQVTDGRGRVRWPAGSDGEHGILLGNPALGGGGGGTGGEGSGGGEGGSPTVDVGKTPSQATPVAKPTKHKVPISLEIELPEKGKKLEIDPGNYPDVLPFMPTLPLRAKVLVQGKPTTIGRVEWQLYISGEYRVRTADNGSEMKQFKFAAGTTRTKPGEKKDFQLAPAEIVGGELLIKATYHGEAELGDVTITKSVKGWKVTGRNPVRENVEKAIADKSGSLAWLFVRMFCHESLHKLAQFTTAGEPLYGPPAGVGIVQRDPMTSEWKWPKSRLTQPNNFFPGIYWDWTKNVEAGIRYFFDEKQPIARACLDELREQNPGLPEYSEGVLLRASIRAYNSGIEYGCADGAHYTVAPRRTSNPTYVADVLHDNHGAAAKLAVPEDLLVRSWPPDPKKKAR